MTSFFPQNSRDTMASKSSLPGQSQQQQQQQRNRQMMKCQRRRENNRFDCLDSTQHSSASSVGTRNNSNTGSIIENGRGLSGTIALPTFLVPSTSSSSSSLTRSLLSGMPGLDQTDHSSLTSTSVATVQEIMNQQRIDKDISKGRDHETIRKRYDDDDDDDENSLGSFGFNDSDDEGGEDSSNNVDANQCVSDETKHVTEKLTSSLSITHAKQQQQKQPKFQQVQQSFNESTVSFSSYLTEVIDVVPNLSPTSKKKYFYSDDELSEFRLEYEFELEGLLPSQGLDES